MDLVLLSPSRRRRRVLCCSPSPASRWTRVCLAPRSASRYSYASRLKSGVLSAQSVCVRERCGASVVLCTHARGPPAPPRTRCSPDPRKRGYVGPRLLADRDSRAYGFVCSDGTSRSLHWCFTYLVGSSLMTWRRRCTRDLESLDRPTSKTIVLQDKQRLLQQE